jgi:hypothetical protein
MTEIVNSLVIMKKKGHDGMSVDLLGDAVTFGRAEDCNIRIAKASVSSLHARIFFDNKQMVRLSRRKISNFFFYQRLFFVNFFFFQK